MNVDVVLHFTIVDVVTFTFDCFLKKHHVFALGIEAVSPDLEKQGFLAVVFVNRE